MSINNDEGNETPIESEFSKLNISINHENCDPCPMKKFCTVFVRKKTPQFLDSVVCGNLK